MAGGAHSRAKAAGKSCVPPACESLHLRMRSCAWFRPLSPASFGPFRRRNGRRQVPSPNVLATELGTIAPHPPSLRPYEFRDQNVGAVPSSTPRYQRDAAPYLIHGQGSTWRVPPSKLSNCMAALTRPGWPQRAAAFEAARACTLEVSQVLVCTAADHTSSDPPWAWPTRNCVDFSKQP
jgi:hypothetical protein